MSEDDSKLNEYCSAEVEGGVEQNVESGSHAHGDNRFEPTITRAELFFPNLGISPHAFAKYELGQGKGHPVISSSWKN